MLELDGGMSRCVNYTFAVDRANERDRGRAGQTQDGMIQSIRGPSPVVSKTSTFSSNKPWVMRHKRLLLDIDPSFVFVHTLLYRR